MEDEGRALPGGSRWWRFDDYEVVDDTHIAPAPDAEFEEYDLFEDHDRFWGGRQREEEPPYVQLVEVNPNDIDQLLEWCNRYGLLGILPHRTSEVRFWPRWSGAAVTGLAGGRVAEQAYFRWGDGGGPGTVVTPVPRGGAEGGDRESEGRSRSLGDKISREEVEVAIGRSLSKGPSIEKPGARVRRIHSGQIQRVGLVEGYGQFFPRRPLVTDWVRDHHQWAAEPERPGPLTWGRRERDERLVQLETQDYPRPATEEFHRQYGEPIPLLQRYVRQIKGVYDFWHDAAEAGTYDDLQRERRIVRPHSDREQPFEEFRAALRSVSPNPTPEATGEGEGFRWPLSWEIPSLYAGLSVMMYQDFGPGEAVAKRCIECQTPFTTSRTDRKYCSDRCGNRHRVRKHREHKDD